MFCAIARSALASTTTHAAATQHAPRAVPAAIAHWAAAASAARAPKPRLLSASTHSATAAAAAPHRRAPLSSVTPYVEVLDSPPYAPTRLLLTCEHASEALPAPWHWGAHDARLRGSHWASDPGAEDFTRELGEAVGSFAVLARFSRLLCDANRPLGAETMFRSTADGLPVGLNDPSRLTSSERAHRESTLWAPYHRALQLAVQELEPRMVLSVHSFTPEYEGQKREVEVGVLYNSERDRGVADKVSGGTTGRGPAAGKPGAPADAGQASVWFARAAV